jgi:hypothetical protein
LSKEAGPKSGQKIAEETPQRPYSADLFSRVPPQDGAPGSTGAPPVGSGRSFGSWPRWLVLGLVVAAMVVLGVVLFGGQSPASKTAAHRPAVRHRSTPITAPASTSTSTSTTIVATSTQASTTTTSPPTTSTTVSPSTTTTSASTTTTTTATTAPAPATTTTVVGVRTIVYQVSGNSSRVILNYINSDTGGTGYNGGASVPSSVTVQLHAGSQFKITAVEADPAGTSVTCSVLDNGQQIQSNTANGQYATATCQGSVS